MSSATERLSVLETKVDELGTRFNSIETKVDTLIKLVDKGNFDSRISKLEDKRWIQPIIYTVVGAIVTFLLIAFIKNPTI